jgi:hypothetical protein
MADYAWSIGGVEDRWSGVRPITGRVQVDWSTHPRNLASPPLPSFRAINVEDF